MECSSEKPRTTKYGRGTACYRAPELIPTGPESQLFYSHQSDIWALGCILHELMVGRTPFPSDIAVANPQQHINMPVANLPDRRSHWILSTLIQNMFSREWWCRPTISEILNLLILLDGHATNVIVVNCQHNYNLQRSLASAGMMIASPIRKSHILTFIDLTGAGLPR